MSAMALPVVEAPWAPLCMEASEWTHWQKLNPALPQNQSAIRPCSDCPPGFAAEMGEVGRCNGTPGGESESPAPMRRALRVQRAIEVRREPDVAALKSGTIRIRFAAPCEDCLHTKLCAIKGLLDMKSAELTLPTLMPPEITGDLSTRPIQVECSEFADADEYARFQSMREKQRANGRRLQAQRREANS